MVKQHARDAITDEVHFYGQMMTRANQEEGATSLLPLTGMFPDPSYSSSEADEKKRNKRRRPSPSKSTKSYKSTCRKCRFDESHSGDYKVDRHKKGAKRLKALKLVKTHFNEALEYESNCLVKQSQELIGHSSEIISK